MESQKSNGNPVSVGTATSSGSTISSGGSIQASSGKNSPHSDGNKCLGEIWFHNMQDEQIQQTDLKLSSRICTSSTKSSTSSTKVADKSSSHTKKRQSSCSVGEKDAVAGSRATRGTTSTKNDEQMSKRRKILSEEKRKERNAREQSRSNQISEQFAELRDLLVSSGVVVPKGTKGAVLSVALDYIRGMQQKRIETDA